MARDKLLGVLAVAAAAFIWGTLGFFAKILYAEGVSFEAVVAVRASIGWATILLFVLLTQGAGSLRVTRGDLFFLVPLGLVGVGAFYLLYFYTVQEGTVGTAAVLLYSSPAFVAVLAWLFLGEALGLVRLFALALTISGIFLVAGAYDPAVLEVAPFVLATGLLSGLTYGLYSIFGKPLVGRLSPAVILSYALGIGAALLLVAALPTIHTLVGLSPSSYALLLANGLVHSALAFGLYTAGLKRLDAGQAAIVATIEPVVAGAIGVALLGEELSAPKLVGASLVLAGAALAQARLGGKPRQEAVTPEAPPRPR